MGGCGDNDAWYRLTQQWYGIGDQGLLDATILAWLQDHQDIRTIQAMAGYLETTYGQSGAILPSSFNTIYAHAFAAGELAQLATNPRAQLLAGAIFAGVGVGGANLGERKQEMAGRTTLLQAPSGSNPWGNGTLESTVVGPEGMVVYRAHGEGRAKGAWVSPQPIPDQQYVRESLAVKAEWNPATYVSEIWLPPGTRIQIGAAGYQGLGYPGGGAQIQILNTGDIAKSAVIRTWQLLR